MAKNYHNNLRQSASERAGTKSNINFGFLQRSAPFRKLKDIIASNRRRIK
ncbi:MAG: hypothetical protein V1858_01845 [Candidatus Gottesmanbacteria bacterium]